jgi:hypothetical protein
VHRLELRVAQLSRNGVKSVTAVENPFQVFDFLMHLSIGQNFSKARRRARTEPFAGILVELIHKLIHKPCG